MFDLNCVMGPLSIPLSTPFSSTLENGVLGGLFGPKREEITGDGRRLNNEGPRDVCVKHYAGDQIKGLWHIWGRTEMHIEFWWRNLMERYQA